MNNTLYIVRGIPGTGKSTFCKKALSGIFHVENDMYHHHNREYIFSLQNQRNAVEWCSDMVTLALKKNMDCVVSNTFVKRCLVDYYVNIAKLFNSNVKIYRMMGNFKNTHNVPEDVFNNMKNNFEDYPGECLVFPNEIDYDFELT